MTTTPHYDVVIIGGSYAGLSAAMALGRSLRKVLLIDSGQPCNHQTPYSHNFLTQDGVAPAQINALAREQVLRYDTVQWWEDLVLTAAKNDEGFYLTTLANKRVSAKKIILATGITDILPSIPGFADCWGISTVHCPYCHGYELRNRKTAIMADVAKAMHLAPLVKNLTDQLTLLVSPGAEFTPEQHTQLAEHNIELVKREISFIEHTNGLLNHIHFTHGEPLSCEALYAAIPFKQSGNLVQTLGCTLTEHGHIEVNSMQQTSVEGVYACGDNAGMMRSVANAVYTGNLAGAMINARLSHDHF
jgi:thioredoxin reductase